MEKKPQAARPDYLNLIEKILTEPGILGDYYSAFHRYSLGNQALAIEQMSMRGIEIGPIASFNGWKDIGRKVKKGEKAIGLWMPVTIKSRDDKFDDGESTSIDGGATRCIFILRNNWFAFSQTEVDPRSEIEPTEPVQMKVQWDKSKALDALGVKEVPFEYVDGNCQGFAIPSLKEVSLNPMAAFPHKTMFHELAHCILHSKEEVAMVDGSKLEKCIKEAEAESVAFLCCSALGLSGLAEARGYVQNWLRSEASRELFKKSAGRVFSTADKILKAGLLAEEKIHA